MTPNEPYVARRCLELESAMSEAAKWAAGNDKLGAYLAGYLTVILCGVVEDCVEHLISLRASKAQDPEVASFINNSIERRFGNPKSDVISGTLNAFSTSYGRDYTQKTRLEEREALDSIVNNKNNLAHVGTWKQELTIREVRGYYQGIQRVLTVLEGILS